jgi:RNA polymerase sigma-70 factor, ECF subfamily
VVHGTMAFGTAPSFENSQGRGPAQLRYAELAKLDDEALMLRLREGHQDALAVLFDRYHRLVMNVGLRILRDAGEAEDLSQSVFLEIFRAAAQFDPAKGTTKVWLLQYAYHRAFNRRHYLSLRGLYDQAEKGNGSNAVSFEREGNDHQRVESSHLVKQALKSLNGTQRQILQLAFYEGLTMREISERTGKSFDSVRHNYYRCLEKLRFLLCERHEIPEADGERVPDVEP